MTRVVTKISSCRVNTTRRRLGISFGSIFLLFSNKRSRGPLSQQPGKIPGPRLLMTTLMTECILGMNDVSTYNYNYKGMDVRNCLTKLFKTTNFDKFLTHLSSLTKSTPTETGGAAMLLFMTGAKFRKINLIAIAPTCTQLQKDSFSVNFVNYIDKLGTKPSYVCPGRHIPLSYTQ